MAECNYGDCGRELGELRAWRALVVEAYGRIRSLESLRFALGMPLDDALASLGLGGSVWARGRWGELCRALAPAGPSGDGADLDAAA